MTETDESLMARLQGGEDLALNELMARWERPLAGYLMRQVGNETAALDLAEETFVRVFESRHRFEGRSTFRTWLYTIATNLCRNHHRWRARHPNVSFDAPAGSDGDTSLGETLSASGPTPAELASTGDEAHLVREAIAQLPEEQRVALLLFEYQDLSHAEIAEILGCSAKAVETRLYRARQTLRERLKSLVA
jgi:RNA polymerase sigma-70 factor, ECF subfamily